ncbi:Uncharacterized protein CCHL11_08951 [Colletotrichum chlorophyti]|uniref:Uncharacterized protein n=1 Tax=Colletotrichum chlorophyti TaxID=708187 RepID=A0A1Q8RSI4_9PEZI|nr:Uncharacterized protein CCHL11_08951 [Colletotrichum chlorophyti]
MASTFRIHRPDVLASLPRPLDHTKGQYHIGEVYSQKAGSKKRKRLEVVVGVDGEAANIYHVPSSGLRTSYPIPPQESFTCAPHSIRYQDATASGRNNYTYLSTQDSSGAKITLCRDVVDLTGKTNSTSTSQRVRHNSPITHLFTSSCVDTNVADETDKLVKGDVVGLAKDGQVFCFDGEALEQRWSASSYNLCRDLLPSTVSKYEVEFAFHAAAFEVMNGLFLGRQDAFGSFGRQIDPKAFNPDVLAIVVRAGAEDATSRFLIVLGVLPTASSQPLVQLHVTPLPAQDDVTDKATYQLHVQSGKLLQLAGSILRTYDLTSAVPKLQGCLQQPAGSSFIQLSEHSVLCLSRNSASILNPTFHSIQASSTVELPESAEKQAPTLVTFLSKLDMAVAVVGNTLISIQIERPKPHGKEGLLIDSIGRGLPRSDRVPATLPKRTGDTTFEKYLPGSLSDEYVQASLADVQKADGFLEAQNAKAFEALLAQRFGVAVEKEEDSNGVETPDWKWLGSPDKYPAVDRRWVLYAISRAFSMATQGPEAGILRCVLSASNVLIYLISAGHLTNANMSAAFKSELADMATNESVIDKLIQCLVDIDPTMELLLNYVSATKLGEKELLLVIRVIMRSLDQQSRLLLPAPSETKEDEYVAMEIDHLEKELELAEYHLGDDSNRRAQALTTAFEKLATYSAVSTVRALRETFDPKEVLALIYLLRVQLIGSAWTSRYFDAKNFEQDDGGRAPPDGAISLIADLLSRCIDSVGPSGWLTTGTSLVGDRADSDEFITALKIEVSAALEGLNEAAHLGGVVSEAVQYGRLAKGGKAGGRGQGVTKPVPVEVEGSPRLPLGLVPKQNVSSIKVVSGGEVLERSSRERGHLLSQKVKAYSLERITI